MRRRSIAKVRASGASIAALAGMWLAPMTGALAQAETPGPAGAIGATGLTGLTLRARGAGQPLPDWLVRRLQAARLEPTSLSGALGRGM